MANAMPSNGDASSSLKGIMSVSVTLLGIAALAVFVSRAPTTFTGTLPFISLPLKLNAIYLIVFGPLATAIVAGVIRYQAGQLTSVTEPSSRLHLLLAIFVLITLLAAFLSLQYFVVLAPAGQCEHPPRFDLLFLNLDNTTRIKHCMSGTEDINKEAPFYLWPQSIQAWGMIVLPVVTGVLFLSAWKVLRQKLRNLPSAL